MGGRLDINAALPRVSDYVKTFLKDWERLSGSGRFDLNRLKEVMMLLVSNDGALAPEWLDHPLKGNWVGLRECHVGGDFLLVWLIIRRCLQSSRARVTTAHRFGVSAPLLTSVTDLEGW